MTRKEKEKMVSSVQLKKFTCVKVTNFLVSFQLIDLLQETLSTIVFIIVIFLLLYSIMKRLWQLQ